MMKGYSKSRASIVVRAIRGVVPALAVAAGASLLPARSALATTYTWTGSTDALWADANWSPAGTPGTGDTVTFNGAGNSNTTISLGAGVTINSVTFDTSSAAGYTIGTGAIGAQTLTLNDAGGITANANLTRGQLFDSAITLGTDATAQSYTVTQNSASGLTFLGNISGGTGGTAGAETLAFAGTGNTTVGVEDLGNGSTRLYGIIKTGGASALNLTMQGSGMLILDGANTYTGTTTITSGILAPNWQTTPLGNVGGNITFSGGTLLYGYFARALDISARVKNSASAINLNLAGQQGVPFATAIDSSNTGGLVISDSYDSYFGAGPGYATMNPVSSDGFTGGLTLNGGSLTLDFSNFTSGYTDLINNGNALTFGGGAMTIKAKTGAITTNQTFNGTTVSAGGGSLLVDTNTGTATNVTLNSLGTLSSWVAGSSLVVGKANTNTGTLTITTSTNKDTTGIYGGRVVWFNGTANTGYDWATTSSGSSPYTLSTYSGYSALAASGTDTNNSRITASNTPSGPITTNSLKIENPAASQTFTLGTNVLTLTSGGLLSTGTNAMTISGTAGSTELTAGNGSGSYDLVIHQYNSGGLTISAVIGDNGGHAVNLVKAGTGTLNLTGVNTYTGTTYINAGFLSLGNNTATGSLSGAGPIVLTDAGTAKTNVGTLQFYRSTGNTITQGTDFGTISGNGQVVQAGAGTVILNAANAYTGGTQITGTGNIQCNAANVLGQGSLYLGNATGTLNMNGYNQTVTAPPGQFSLFINGAWTLNTGSATLTIAGGDIGAANALGGLAGNVNLGGNVVSLSANAKGAGLTISGALSNGGLIRGTASDGVSSYNGNGWFYLTGANTYTGPTTYAGGTSSDIDGASGFYLGNGGLTGSLNPAGLIDVYSGLYFGFYRSNSITQGVDFPAITGAGGITQWGWGTTVLTNINSYTGTTYVTYGSLKLGQTNALPTANALNISPVSNGVASFDLGGYNQTLTGTLTLGGNGNGSVAQVINSSTTASTLTLGGAASALTYGGSTYLGAIISVNTVDLNGATQTFTVNHSLTNVNTNSTANSFINTGGMYDLTVSSVIQHGTLNLAGGGFLQLTGQNTYTGGTTLTSGTLCVASTENAGTYGPLGASGNITFAGGTLQWSAANQYDYSGRMAVSSNATFYFDTNGQPVTLATALPVTGTNPLVKYGLGTLTLSAANNTYAGATTVDAGLLQVNGTLAAGGGTVTVAGPAAATYAAQLGGTGTINRAVTLAASGAANLPAAAINLTSTTGQSLTIGNNSTLTMSGTAAIPNYLYLTATSGGIANIAVTGSGAVAETNAGGAAVYLKLNPSSLPANGPYNLITAGSGITPANFANVTGNAFGKTITLGGSSTALTATVGTATAGPAAAFWGGSSDTKWSTAGNWYTTVGGGTNTGAVPGLNTNVTMYTTTPVAANLTTMTLNSNSFEINSLNYTGSSATTIAGAPYMLNIQASTANSNPTANGITVSAGSHTISANVGLESAQTWTINGGTALTVSGVISDFGLGNTLTVGGGGTLTLSGNNTFSGGITLNSGTTLSLGTTTSCALGTGTLTINGGTINNVNSSTVNTGNNPMIWNASFAQTGASSGIDMGTGNVTLNANITITTATTFLVRGVISDGGNHYGITQTGNHVTLYGANTFSGLTKCNNNFIVDNYLAFQNAPIDMSGAGTYSTSGISNLVIGGLQGTSSPTAFTTAFSSGTINSLTLNTYNTSQTWSYSGVIANSAGTAMTLTKTGAGTQALSGNNTYGGTTTINAGTLLANNATSSTGTGAVVVNNGGTLGGNGTITGLTTVNSGGIIAPGVNSSTIGILTDSGGMTFNSGASFTWKISSLTASPGTNQDELELGTAGTLTLNSGGSYTINISRGAGIATADANGDTFVVADAHVINTAGATINVVDPSGVDNWTASVISGGNGQELEITAATATAPEPGSLGLLGAAALGLLRRRRTAAQAC